MIVPSQLLNAPCTGRTKIHTAGSKRQLLYHPSVVHSQRVMSVGLPSVDTVYHLVVLPGSCYSTDGSWADHNQLHSFITNLRRIPFAMMVPHACVPSFKTFECRLVESIKNGCPLIDSANVSMISPVPSLSHYTTSLWSHTHTHSKHRLYLESSSVPHSDCWMYLYLSHPQLGLWDCH